MSTFIQVPFLSCKVALHCTRRCDNCDTLSPWQPKWFLKPEELKNDLAELSRSMRVGRLFLNGGEPLLHPQFPELLRIAKHSGVAAKVVVITNGDLLEKAPEEFWKLADEVQVSVYPDSNYKWEPKEIEAKIHAAGVDFQLVPRPNFDMIWINNRINHPPLAQFVWDKCLLKDLCLEMQNGHFYRCAPHAYFKDRMKLTGFKQDASDEGLRFRGNPNLKEDFAQFMARKTPLEACHWCLGSIGVPERVVQLDATQRKERLARDQKDLVQLIDWNKLTVRESE